VQVLSPTFLLLLLNSDFLMQKGVVLLEDQEVVTLEEALAMNLTMKKTKRMTMQSPILLLNEVVPVRNRKKHEVPLASK
jgi:hypothetical protein